MEQCFRQMVVQFEGGHQYEMVCLCKVDTPWAVPLHDARKMWLKSLPWEQRKEELKKIVASIPPITAKIDPIDSGPDD